MPSPGCGNLEFLISALRAPHTSMTHFPSSPTDPIAWSLNCARDPPTGLRDGLSPQQRGETLGGLVLHTHFLGSAWLPALLGTVFPAHFSSSSSPYMHGSPKLEKMLECLTRGRQCQWSSALRQGQWQVRVRGINRLGSSRSHQE